MSTPKKARADDPSEEHLRHNLRARREASDVSQAELAARLERLGHPLVQQTIAKIESGKRPIRFDEAVALARALETTLDQLSNPTLPDGPEDVRTQLKETRRRVADLEEYLPIYEREYLESKSEVEKIESVFKSTKWSLIIERGRLELLEERLAALQRDAGPTKGASRGKRQAKG
jgi:transcriptional regulator with XRE-family HTH domain